MHRMQGRYGGALARLGGADFDSRKRRGWMIRPGLCDVQRDRFVRSRSSRYEGGWCILMENRRKSVPNRRGSFSLESAGAGEGREVGEQIPVVVYAGGTTEAIKVASPSTGSGVDQGSDGGSWTLAQNSGSRVSTSAGWRDPKPIGTGVARLGCKCTCGH